MYALSEIVGPHDIRAGIVLPSLELAVDQEPGVVPR